MTSPPPRPTETEIKFHLLEGGAAALDAHPLLRGCEAEPPSRQVTTYFDTADHALARAGASLRLRRTGNRRVQTLKLRDGRAPFGRGEWEWPVKGDRPEPQHLAETPAGAVAGPLSPVFTAEVTRSLRRLRLDGAVIEITFDSGALRAGGREEPVAELELELKEGRPAALYRLAEALLADLPLVLGTEAKSDRGWRLLTGEPRRAEKPGRIDLPRSVTAAEGFRLMVGETLSALLAHQPAAAAGSMEGVHGMRVALRRLRALLVLFRPHLAPGPEARLTAALRDLAGVLGEARDLDVFVVQTLPGIAGREVEPLLPLAEAARAAAHRRVAEEFGRPGLTRAVLGLAAWAEDPDALSGRSGGGELAEPLLDLAPGLVEGLARKARRRGRHIRRRPEAELHDLRKALKKLRYGVEFLASLHREKRVEAYLHRCRDLQETLGALNDATVATSLAERLAQGNPALAPAVAAVRDRAMARAEEARGGLRKAWRAFRDTPLPRPIG